MGTMMMVYHADKFPTTHYICGQLGASSITRDQLAAVGAKFAGLQVKEVIEDYSNNQWYVATEDYATWNIGEPTVDVVGVQLIYRV